jgi:hypothetical protein
MVCSVVGRLLPDKATRQAIPACGFHATLPSARTGGGGLDGEGACRRRIERLQSEAPRILWPPAGAWLGLTYLVNCHNMCVVRRPARRRSPISAQSTGAGTYGVIATFSTPSR